MLVTGCNLDVYLRCGCVQCAWQYMLYVKSMLNVRTANKLRGIAFFFFRFTFTMTFFWFVSFVHTFYSLFCFLFGLTWLFNEHILLKTTTIYRKRKSKERKGYTWNGEENAITLFLLHFSLFMLINLNETHY